MQRSVSYKTYCKAEFGYYVEASTNTMLTSSQIPRRHDCIALGSSGNRQGLLTCFDLKTGSVVTRGIFDVLPMPDRIVKQVNACGMKSKKESRKIKLKFKNSQRRKIDWDNEDLEDNENVE